MNQFLHPKQWRRIWGSFLFLAGIFGTSGTQAMKTVFCDAEIWADAAVFARGSIEQGARDEEDEEEFETPDRPITALSDVTRELLELPDKESIEVLSFYDSQMTDEIFNGLTESVAGAYHCLRILDLSGNQLSADCAPALERWVADNPDLISVALWGNTEFTGRLLPKTLEKLKGEVSPAVWERLIVFNVLSVRGERTSGEAPAELILNEKAPGWLERHQSYFKLLEGEGLDQFIQSTHDLEEFTVTKDPLKRSGVSIKKELPVKEVSTSGGSCSRDRSSPVPRVRTLVPLGASRTPPVTAREVKEAWYRLIPDWDTPFLGRTYFDEFLAADRWDQTYPPRRLANFDGATSSCRSSPTRVIFIAANVCRSCRDLYGGSLGRDNSLRLIFVAEACESCGVFLSNINPERRNSLREGGTKIKRAYSIGGATDLLQQRGEGRHLDDRPTKGRDNQRTLPEDPLKGLTKPSDAQLNKKISNSNVNSRSNQTGAR